MQVVTLQLFLRSLVPALEAAGESRNAARAIEAASHALDPFGRLGIDEFSAFLVRANEFHRTGAVRVPGPADQHADRVLAAVARLSAARERLTSPNAASELESARTDLADSLRALAESAGFAATLKADPKWIAEQVIQARINPHCDAIRSLAAQISTPESYQADQVRESLARLEAEILPADLKAVGATFGIKVTAKATANKVVHDVLTKLTGHKPAKVKAAGKRTSAVVDPAVVESHARRLAELIARAAGPEGLPGNEVEAELARLKALTKQTLVEVVRAAGIEGVPASESAAAILQRVRNRLTIAQRARERTEV